MKKYLIALLLIIASLCFPLYTNDYVDITHMVTVSSIGLSYENDEINVYAYVINNYTMSKSDFNTSSTNSAATIITSKSKTIDNAFFLMKDAIFVNLNFSFFSLFLLQQLTAFLTTLIVFDVVLSVDIFEFVDSSLILLCTCIT